MIEWPSSKLPSPRVDYSYKGESAVISNSMESGATRQRRRFSRRRKVANLKWVMSFSELALFESFFEHKLAFGANEFLIDLPSSGDLSMAPHKVVIQNGSYDVKTLAGTDKWEVQSNVIADDFSVFTEGIYDVLVESADNGQDFIAASDALETEISHFSSTHSWN